MIGGKMQDQEKFYEIVELARKSGKIKKGVNEVTKEIERGTPKLVIVAEDVNPAEITMHIEPLCNEKKIKCAKVPKKEELGVAAGLSVATSAVAIIEPGEAKGLIESLKDEKV